MKIICLHLGHKKKETTFKNKYSLIIVVFFNFLLFSLSNITDNIMLLLTKKLFLIEHLMQ